MRNNSHHEISWFLVIVGFVVFWPLGLFLLISKLGSENTTPEQRQGWANDINNSFHQVKDDLRNSANQVHRDFSSSSHAGQPPLYTDPQQSRANQGFGSSPRPGGSTDTQRPIHRGQSGTYHDTTSGSYNTTGAQSGTYRNKTESFQRPVSAVKNTFKKIKSGHSYTIAGLIMLLIFGIGTVSGFVDAMPNVLYAIKESIAPFMFTGIGAGLFAFGRFTHRKAKKFRKMFNLIGTNKVIDIHTLAEAMPCSYDHACDLIQSMIDKGYLGKRAYINMSTGELFMDADGLDLSKQSKPKKQEKQTEQSKEEAEERSILEEIRHVNEAIPDPTLTRKINRIEEITGHILDYQKKHPEKAADLRKFLNYYLPTTLKILKTYAELDRQGVSGENISATKTRIEGMIDMIVEGFETQLDKLFAGDMLDISSDIAVMEKMMNSDGLAGGMKMPSIDDLQDDGGIHLTLDPDGEVSAANSAATSSFSSFMGATAPAAPEPAAWQNGFYRKSKDELS